VIIASAYGTEDTGLESCQGVRFLGFIYIAALLSKLNMRCYCLYIFGRNKFHKKLSENICLQVADSFPQNITKLDLCFALENLALSESEEEDSIAA
jgi:hypothetical protein